MEPEIKAKRRRLSAVTLRAVGAFAALCLVCAAVAVWYQRRPVGPVYSAKELVPRANRIAFSPERGTKYVAVAFSDGRVRLWDTATQREVAVKLPSQWPLNDLAWSADGNSIFTGGFEQHVLAFNIKASRGGKLPIFAAPIVSLAVHPIKPELLISVANGELWWLDLQSGERAVVATGHKGIVKVVRYHPLQPVFITAGTDGQVVWHDSLTRSVSKTVAAHQNEVSCLAIAADGARVVSRSWDNTVKIWQGDSTQPVATLTHPDGVAEVAWSGMDVVSSCWDGELRVWNVDSASVIRERACRSDALKFAVWPGRDVIAEVDSAGTLHLGSP